MFRLGRYFRRMDTSEQQDGGPGRFRKRPVEVEAMRYVPGETCEAVHEWMGIPHNAADCGDDVELYVETREGTMCAEPGDWIIAEPFPSGDRHFYPCKPDIFERTYEAAVAGGTPEFDYRLVDEFDRPLDDDREEHESPTEWLERWRTVEGWPEARLQRRPVTRGAWEVVPDGDA